jgi:hypothetical protein
MCLRVRYREKYEFFFASLKSLKKGVGSRSGSTPKCHGSPTLLYTVGTYSLDLTFQHSPYYSFLSNSGLSPFFCQME